MVSFFFVVVMFKCLYNFFGALYFVIYLIRNSVFPLVQYQCFFFTIYFFALHGFGNRISHQPQCNFVCFNILLHPKPRNGSNPDICLILYNFGKNAC